MQAHSAPLGLAFVQSAMFPASYQGDLIVAFHGSWNRSVPTGYKLVRLPVRDGQPTGQVLDFLTGFWADDAWSRPVGVVFGPDQALYVSDDRAGAIFRITYGAAGP
jgi:glucose/arabinose dehydrogenase